VQKSTVSIIGGSGFTGGELLRLLLQHPYAEVKQITSQSSAGKFVYKAHPHLRKNTLLKFCSTAQIEQCDVIFLCLPHGESMQNITLFQKKAHKIIDLSSDFRLNDEQMYQKWYHKPHLNPELLQQFIYGIPELHREEMRTAKFISSAGCNATAVILALLPLYKNNIVELDKTVVEVKVGSSEGGNQATAASHHPVRKGCVRSFMPTQHRHIAEMEQELSFGRKIKIHFSATSIEMVRGVLATCHTFLNKKLSEKDIWKLYREGYGDEPFIRLVKEKDGIYRFPEPKILVGSNYCDIGFEVDDTSNRLVVISAIDNLMKGAAGQALQAFNIMMGYEESSGLNFPGLHPI